MYSRPPLPPPRRHYHPTKAIPFFFCCFSAASIGRTLLEDPPVFFYLGHFENSLGSDLALMLAVCFFSYRLPFLQYGTPPAFFDDELLLLVSLFRLWRAFSTAFLARSNLSMSFADLLPVEDGEKTCSSNYFWFYLF